MAGIAGRSGAGDPLEVPGVVGPAVEAAAPGMVRGLLRDACAPGMREGGHSWSGVAALLLRR